MTSPTAADYGWIRSPSSLFAYALEVGYTLTLVRGVSPTELLRVVEAEPLGACHGVGELIEEHGEFTDTYNDSFLAGVCTVPGEGGDWTLALDFGGDLGIRPRLMEALSVGSRAVSHSSNAGKPMDFFHWYENGELRTTFERSACRTGSTPDELNAVMSEVGLDPVGDGFPGVDRKAAVFALAERLTGVRVAEELLRGAAFQMGEVPEERAEEWRSITIDLRDPHGEGLYIQVDRDQL